MFETNINLIGNVATDVKFVVPNRPENGGEGQPFAKFRVASTSRKFDRSSATWVPGDTLFAEVVCFRRLAEHVTTSLAKGDPVMVSGKLRLRTWQTEENRRGTDLEVVANAVGHNLTFGTAMFSKSLHRTKPEPAAEDPFAPPTGDRPPMAEVSVLPGARQVADIRSVGDPADVSGVQPPRPEEDGNTPPPEPSHTSPAADEQAA